MHDATQSSANFSIPSVNASRKSIVLMLLGVLLLLTSSSVTSAEEPSKPTMQSLDEQVQEIKSDVLAIAAELSNLEEKLLYPSNSQVAIFLGLEEGESLELDSVQISIDGELVAHHIYSFKELTALQKGGLQRIYTGNVRTGEHRLDVSIAGRTNGGRDVRRSQTFSFDKEVDPKLVGITLASQATGGPTIAVGGW